MLELLDTANDSDMPLAARMRPQSIDDIVGQDILAPGKPLRVSIEKGTLQSIILWGPPGSGKTTIAEVIAHMSHAYFARVSAVASGVADLRKVVAQAKALKETNKKTILFIDEIHRFNKAQQDVILPYVEEGTVTLIGATTENPSFEVNRALLSRSKLFVLKALNDDAIVTILNRALTDKKRGLGNLSVHIDILLLEKIAAFANGDARVALNVLDMAVQSAGLDDKDEIAITSSHLEEVVQNKSLLYDKHGDMHYDMISALHKSLRGSDPDAGLYWLGRMLEAGEDPLYIIRRLIRFASEDIGIADSQALVVCIAAQQAIHFVGLPEANLALAQAVVYLALSAKSNALYSAYSAVQEDVKKTRNDPVPLHLRNAPTKTMKDLGYGKNYLYAHDAYKQMNSQDNLPPQKQLQQYLPDNIKNHAYYYPSLQGREAKIKEWLEKRRQKSKQP